MGSDAEIYLFDYRRYRGEVVPALVDLLRTGEPGPYLTGFFRDTVTGHRMDFDSRWPVMAAHLRYPPADLARWCTWLSGDLGLLGVHTVDQRGDLICPSLACPERGHCVLHRDRAAGEHLNVLYEALVWTRCLDRPQFVGRTFDPYSYIPLLDALGVPAADPLRRLLTALGSRGAVFGYMFGTTEGVHGWLTDAETAELAHRLNALPLPRFEASYPAMRNLHYAAMSRTAQAHARGEEEPAWLEMSLAFVRTVATIAASEGRAVLWGNDVGYDHWIDSFFD